MCGIAGLIDPGAAPDLLERRLAAMTGSLRHRGPDDGGLWIEGPAGLGHRRLSILDLSPAGRQPMISADERFVLAYNGEVYSHDEIRVDLEARGRRFRGHSDTEVILEAIAADGLDATLPRLIGMFALALWDRAERSLTLVRDRLGIKPLYWARFGGLFLFGSELKALREHPGWSPEIDRGAIAAYLRHNVVPAPFTAYRGVAKLEPGCVLTLPWGGEPVIRRFWDARAVAAAGLAARRATSDGVLVERLEALLLDAVRRRMVADVPVGAFLSGGIDSSIVAAMMQRAAAGPVKTFSIGFEEADFDEAPFAAAVARHLGTDHTELRVTAGQALDVVPRLPEWFDEPFADSSQIPTALISALTRSHVTVALSGDGGDELFAGYNRYRWARRLWSVLSYVPAALRRGVAARLEAVRPERWDGMLPGVRQAGDKVHKLAGLLRLEGPNDLYRRLVTHWEPVMAESRGILWDESLVRDIPDPLDRMQFLDLVTYLPDDILTKVDRASMAVGLEARVPLLDHRVVEFAWSLPPNAKIRGGVAKWLLRQVLYRHVPSRLVERPKAGFAVPLADWLRGPLRDWAESLLAERRLAESGLVDAPLVRRHWQDHLDGKRNSQYLLWDVLMLEAWRARWM